MKLMRKNSWWLWSPNLKHLPNLQLRHLHLLLQPLQQEPVQLPRRPALLSKPRAQRAKWKRKKEKSAEPEKKSDSSDTPMDTGIAPTSGVAASDLVVGEDYNLMVQNIMDMGYGKDEVVAALTTSFNNPDRAV